MTTVWHLGRDTLEETASEAVANHQGSYCDTRSHPPAEVGDPPTQIVEKRPVQRDTEIPRSRRRIAVEDDQPGDEDSYSISPWSPWGIALSDSEKAETLADNLEAQFQPVTDPSVRQLSRRLTWR